MSSGNSSRGRSNRSRASPRHGQRPSPRPTPGHSPLSSQHPSRHPSQRPSPERPEQSGVLIATDSRQVPVLSHYTTYNEVVNVPAPFTLPQSRQHITQVLGESRSVNTNADLVIISSGKICLKIIYIL
jgi:hypothetical protein